MQSSTESWQCKRCKSDICLRVLIKVMSLLSGWCLKVDRVSMGGKKIHICMYVGDEFTDKGVKGSQVISVWRGSVLLPRKAKARHVLFLQGS